MLCLEIFQNAQFSLLLTFFAPWKNKHCLQLSLGASWMGWRLNSLLDSMMEDFIATPLSGWVRKLPKPLMLWIWSCLMLSLSQVMPLPTWQSRIPHWAYPAIWIVVVIWSTGPFLSFEIFLKKNFQDCYSSPWRWWVWNGACTMQEGFKVFFQIKYLII